MINSRVNFLAKIPIRCWNIHKIRQGFTFFCRTLYIGLYLFGLLTRRPLELSCVAINRALVTTAVNNPAMLRRTRLCHSMSSDRLSVCPSVTFRYRDHIGWNTSKIISRLINLRYMLGLTPAWAIWCNENRGGVMSKKSAISLKRCKTWPWTAETDLCGKKSFYRAQQKNLNEDRRILSAAKYRSMILVSRLVYICGYSLGFLGEERQTTVVLAITMCFG